MTGWIDIMHTPKSLIRQKIREYEQEREVKSKSMEVTKNAIL